MLKGVYLTMLIGVGVPMPAPKMVMDLVSDIQVNNGKERNGFQVSFTMDKKATFITGLINSGFFDPTTTRVIIVATMNGIPHVLIDGIISNHQIGPASEPGKSTFTITGEDVSVLMDMIEVVVPMPALPDVAKVYTALAPFSFLGFTPIVIPPPVFTVRSPTDNWETIPKQTPLQFLRTLARENGYVFMIIPGPLPAQNIAYFGPEISIPIPQRALSINMDAHTNVESLSFTMDGLAKKINIYTIFDEVTKKITIPIPVPNINALKPPMGIRTTQPIFKVGFADSFSKKNTSEAMKKIMGVILSSANNPPSVTANGSLDVSRYKGILRSGMLVGVRGAGIAYDGIYYVDTVTHNIKQGLYKQNFTLSRDGVISNTPVVIA